MLLTVIYVFEGRCLMTEIRLWIARQQKSLHFFGYDKQSPAYLIYFPETIVIKKVRCVKFTVSYDNNTLSKPDNNTENLES